MHNYIFRTYIDGGREYYEYTDAADREQTIKKDFPFPESLPARPPHRPPSP